MPQQVVDTGFDGCGSVRVSYSPGATPTNSPPLDDAEGRYFLVDRTDPAQALKIVLEHTLASDPYDQMYAQGREIGIYETYSNDQVVQNPVDDPILRYGRGPYTRYVIEPSSESYSDGGFRNITDRVVYRDASYQSFDDDGNPILISLEAVSLSVVVAISAHALFGTGANGPIFLDVQTTVSDLTLRTGDGRKIDWETGAVSDGWSIIVYETYEWGDSELTRFRFDTDPNPISVKCLNSECDEDCIPIYDSNDAFICICRDNGEPNEIDDYDYQPYEHNTTQPHFNEYQP
jgi:hypothetical protein